MRRRKKTARRARLKKDTTTREAGAMGGRKRWKKVSAAERSDTMRQVRLKGLHRKEQAAKQAGREP